MWFPSRAARGGDSWIPATSFQKQSRLFIHGTALPSCTWSAAEVSAGQTEFHRPRQGHLPFMPGTKRGTPSIPFPTFLKGANWFQFFLLFFILYQKPELRDPSHTYHSVTIPAPGVRGCVAVWGCTYCMCLPIPGKVLEYSGQSTDQGL